MILLLLAAVSDPATLMGNARSLLAPTCGESACAGAAKRRTYRIDTEPEAALTSKDRAIRDDGTRCNVVGARRCPKRGRTIFRTDFAQ